VKKACCWAIVRQAKESYALRVDAPVVWLTPTPGYAWLGLFKMTRTSYEELGGTLFCKYRAIIIIRMMYVCSRAKCGSVSPARTAFTGPHDCLEKIFPQSVV